MFLSILIGTLMSSVTMAANLTETTSQIVRSNQILEEINNDHVVLIELDEVKDCENEPCPKIYAGAFLGNSMGANIYLKLNRNFVFDLGLQENILPSRDFNDPSITSPTTFSFVGAARITLLNDTVEVGARYQTMSMTNMNQQFKDSFSSIGYDVHVNLVQSSKGKFYIAIASTTNSFEPSQFKIGGILKLN